MDFEPDRDATLREACDRLVDALKRALWTGDRRKALVRSFEKLLNLAEKAQHEEAWVFAMQHLSAELAEVEPWRGALFARRLLAIYPNDAPAWGAMGLAMSRLGNHTAAVSAYRKAIAKAPDNLAYLHNLGHLLDVAFDDLEGALALLGSALERWERRDPSYADVAASYAHALARKGDAAKAARILGEAIVGAGTREQNELLRHLVTLQTS